MRRLYFLVPGVDSAKAIVDELLLERVEWRHIHVIARGDIALDELPQAELAQRSDVLPALQRGVAAGAVTGALAGLVAMAFPPAGLTIAGGAVVALTLAGGGFGAWMATMVGVDLPNTRLERYESAVADGQLLMMVDVPLQHVEQIEALVRRLHPEADVRGADPTIPAFP